MVNGKQGIQGFGGIQGVQGVQGVPGVQGLNGVPGEQGKRGQSGFVNHPVSYKISSVILFIMLISLMAVSYFILVPYKIFEVSGIEILTPEVRAGEQLIYKVSYCKYSNLQGTISKTLVNSIIIPFTPYVINAPVGCGIRTVYQEIPLFAPSGTYHLGIISTYRPNPIRVVNIEYKTGDFTVKGDE